MADFPQPIAELIEELNKLPGIGPKTAERFAYHLVQQPGDEIKKLIRALNTLRDTIKTCGRCFRFSELDPCSICRDTKRNSSTLCVVAHSPQIGLVERTGEFTGRYFVLGGVLNPVDGITPDRLNIDQLVARVQDNQPPLTEVILALNPDVEGESTAVYLKKVLSPYVKTVTRLGRGLPVGGDLDYADEVTLADSLKGRRAT
ncbi:MAG: recombination mediator RecR [bacterium]|nr:recombination mediator RecR [bacterium]